MQTVSIERQDALAIVRYDRGEKANALGLQAIRDLSAAADVLAEDTGCHIVVLTGTSRFSAGVDLADDGLWRPGADPVERAAAMSAGGAMCDRWLKLPQIVIAAIEGPAIGGGGILALAADFRVMADTAYFRFPEVRLGMTLGWGGLPLLAGLIGTARAKHALFTDRRISAAEALDIGLCETVAPAAGALDAALELAGTVAGCPPAALRMTKRTVDSQLRHNWAGGYEADQFFLSRLLGEDRA